MEDLRGRPDEALRTRFERCRTTESRKSTRTFRFRNCLGRIRRGERTASDPADRRTRGQPWLTPVRPRVDRLNPVHTPFSGAPFFHRARSDAQGGSTAPRAIQCARLNPTPRRLKTEQVREADGLPHPLSPQTIPAFRQERSRMQALPFGPSRIRATGQCPRPPGSATDSTKRFRHIP